MKMVDIHISCGREFIADDKNTIKCSHSTKLNLQGVPPAEIGDLVARCRTWLEQRNDEHIRTTLAQLDIEKAASKKK